ncbi:uncharacterized protein [Setaria viridis]|uniref:uncharacterized protein n=1 Tax=Setaria viridis TaxID=4556 RepID=UPI003B3A6B0D
MAAGASIWLPWYLSYKSRSSPRRFRLPSAFEPSCLPASRSVHPRLPRFLRSKPRALLPVSVDLLPPPAMGSWGVSHFTSSRAEGLVRKGLLCERTAAGEWELPGMEQVPSPPPGYVISFAHFHERGFASPPSRFFRGLLHHYGLELQHLNPNGIQHIAAFIALCEGFLGIEPHFSLWKYFFTVSLYQKSGKAGSQQRSPPVPIGCAGIHLRHTRSKEYMTVKTSASHKGWHNQWFYVKSYPDSPLPAFTGRTIDAAPEVWAYGPVEKKKKRFSDLLQAIEQLKRNGLTGAGVIGAYHARRVAPLMLRTRPLGAMTPDTPTEGTALATGTLAASEIRQWLREALEDKDVKYPIPGHPPMRPEAGFIDLVRSWGIIFLPLCPAICRSDVELFCVCRAR